MKIPQTEFKSLVEKIESDIESTEKVGFEIGAKNFLFLSF